jgi:hypothetical protein
MGLLFLLACSGDTLLCMWRNSAKLKLCLMHMLPDGTSSKRFVRMDDFAVDSFSGSSDSSSRMGCLFACLFLVRT